jgi:putative transposase
MKLKALKLRIYPNIQQTILLNKTFGCSRFIYNTMLAERKSVYEELKDKPRELYEHKYRTEKQLKEKFEFLKEVDSISLQQTRMNLGVAYENFFRKLKNPKIPSSEKGFPKFKKKNSRNSFRTIMVANNLKVDFEHKKIKAPKLGWITFRDNRVIENIKIHNMTFSRTPSLKYYVSILYEDITQIKETVDITNPNLKIKGLDMSLTNFFVDDKGNSPQYDRNYRKAEFKIVELQRKISTTKLKCLKKKLRLRLSRLHEHIANKRKDFNEKLSNKLVNENDVIVIESLSLKDMAKFKKWSERKDSKDKSNHGKSVNDLGWYYFVNRLKTKAEEQGKTVIEANKWFASSKTCNICGYVNKDLTISDRSWICPKCGTEHNRDENAAINLKNVALNIFTEGTSGSAELALNRNHL